MSTCLCRCFSHTSCIFFISGRRCDIRESTCSHVAPSYLQHGYHTMCPVDGSKETLNTVYHANLTHWWTDLYKVCHVWLQYFWS